MARSKQGATATQGTKILLIGSLPPPIGGVTVSFEMMVNYYAGNPDMLLFDLSAVRRQSNRITLFFHLIIAAWRKIGQCDVVTLYCSHNGIATIGLLSLLFARIRGKAFIYRKPGGSDYLEGSKIRRWANAVVVHGADMFLAQTRQLVALAKSRGVKNVRWFPTTRIRNAKVISRNKCRRFIFVSQVREVKGVNELLKASRLIPGIIEIDVYGPNDDQIDIESWKTDYPRLHYCGSLAPNDVQPTMALYDALVLPTKWVAEGYPGAILEAFNVGLPVITTSCGGIPELVNESCGIIVPPGDVEELSKAMMKLYEDDQRYQLLVQGAIARGEDFNARHWLDIFAGYCIETRESSARK